MVYHVAIAEELPAGNEWSHCTCKGLTEVGPVFPTSLATLRWLYPHGVVQYAHFIGQFHRQVGAASVLPPNATHWLRSKWLIARCETNFFVLSCLGRVRTFLVGESAGTVTVLHESTDTISLDTPFKL